MIEKPTGYLTDDKGVQSSKRLLGTTLLLVSIFLSAFLCVTFALDGKLDEAIEIVKTLVYAGSGLLGLGIFEKAFKK